MNKWRKILKREKGFTLIELLIVIAIIAVLAVIIIPRVTTSLTDANEATSDANIKLVQSAVERYYFDKNEYPFVGNGTTGSTEKGGNLLDTGTIELSKLVDGGYIDTEPEGYTFQLTDGVVTATP